MNRLPDQSPTPQAPSCPECGASQIDGLTCWDKLGMVLAWEAQDPKLAAEHFLTVACYNLQHPAQFTEAALASLREGLILRLDSGMSLQALRQRASRAFEGKTRVLKPEAERRPVLRHWPMTLSEVYADGQPTQAAERVREWAVAIHHEL